MANDCDAVLIASAVATGLPYGGSPVLGAVGEMASMKRHKLWKMGEDGLCCSSSAIQTRLGPSTLLEERSKTPIVFVPSLCCRPTPKLGEMAKVYRITSAHASMKPRKDLKL